MSNIASNDEILTRVDELAKDAVNGGDALPNLAMELSRWAQQGSVVLNHETPHAVGLMDVKDVFIRYADTQGKAMHARSTKSNTVDAQVSKMKVFHKVGANPNWDGPDFFQQVTDLRNALVVGDLKVKPAFDAMLSAGRALLSAHNDKDNSRDGITEDEIRDAIIVHGKSTPTAITIYQQADRLFHRLLSEKLETSDATKKIREAIKLKIADMRRDEAIAEWQSQGISLGINSVELPA